MGILKSRMFWIIAIDIVILILIVFTFIMGTDHKENLLLIASFFTIISVVIAVNFYLYDTYKKEKQDLIEKRILLRDLNREIKDLELIIDKLEKESEFYVKGIKAPALRFPLIAFKNCIENMYFGNKKLRKDLRATYIQIGSLYLLVEDWRKVFVSSCLNLARPQQYKEFIEDCVGIMKQQVLDIRLSLKNLKSDLSKYNNFIN